MTGPDTGPSSRHPMTGNRMDPGDETEPSYGTGFETHAYDVVVIGAGGAGHLRRTSGR